MAAPAAASFSPLAVSRLWGFAPFFTLQPVDASRATQLEAWGRLVVALCAHRRQPRLALRSPEAAALFENGALDPPRRLPEAGVRAVADALVEAGRAEWADAAGGERSMLLVFEQPPRELAVRLDEWLRANYHAGLLRLADLRNAPDFEIDHVGFSSSPLWNLDGLTALRAVEVLQREGRVDLAGKEGERPDPDKVQIMRYRPA